VSQSSTDSSRIPTSRGIDRGLAGLDNAAPRVSLGDVVAERLRQAIINDDLTPGQHLREEEISEMLDVSRGPVRDAFILLEREGLVQLSRHRGAKVVELSAIDLGEVYSLRSAIEELAVRLAIRRHEPHDIEALEASVAEMRSALKRKDKFTGQEAARLDVEFHDAIFRAAHHERLYASWSSIRMQVYWFLRQRNIASSDWRTNTVAGHESILGLITSGQEEAAATQVHTHIRAAYDRIIGQLDLDAPDSHALDVAESFLLA
jgi:DNA-binding GntR family transcriptional regulator